MVDGILKVPFPVLILQSKEKLQLNQVCCNSLSPSQTAFSRKKTTKMKRGHFNGSICDDSVNVLVTYIFFLLW